MQSSIHICKMLIKECHLDTFGHVNNAMYLVLMEEARWDWITSNGYGLNKVVESGIGPTILNINISFSKELLLREEITIESQVTSYTKKIFIVQQRVLRGQEVCATAEFTMALFDLKQRKLIAPTEEWLQGLGINHLS